ncbi:unnamed protein product [Absidia cylindrospora]
MVNTMNLEHRPHAVSCLSKETLDWILQSGRVDFLACRNDDVKLLMTKLAKIYEDDGVVGLRKYILKEKLEAYEANHDVKCSNRMMILDIMNHILDMVEYRSWNSGQSEAEYFDYWKPIFKTLFRDTDNISIKTGETTCLATKYDRQLNEINHGDIIRTSLEGVLQSGLTRCMGKPFHLHLGSTTTIK